jgi:photosystem II stability/assembly factor-like uncharacterized protein
MVKLRVLLLLLVSAAIWAVSTSHAQPLAWEPTSGPEGGQTSRVLTAPGDSSTVYSVVHGSLYRSEDHGHSWRELPHAWDGTLSEIGALVVTPSDVVLAASVVWWNGDGVHQAGVARSTDGGETWAPLEVGPPEGSDVVVSAFYWLGGERVVGGTGANLFVSDDAGTTWSPFTVPVPPGTQLGNLATHPSGILAANYSDSESSAGVVLSFDGGQTWTTTTLATPPAPGEPWFNALSVAADGTLFGTNFSEPHVWRSVDLGATWTTTSLDVRGLFSIVTTAEAGDGEGLGALYAATRQGGSYFSSDGGVTWEPFGLDGLWVQAYARVGTSATGGSGGAGDLLAGTEDGVYRRAPGADDWTPSRSGLARMFVQDVAAAPGGVLYASEFLGPVILRSPDGGATWERIDEVEWTSAIALAPDGAIYAGTGAGNEMATLWRSADGSPESFEPLPSFPGLGAPVVHVTPVGTVLAGNRGLYRSADEGTTWATVFDDERVVTDVVTEAGSASGMLYAGTTRGVFCSTDDGATWEQIGLEEETVGAVWASGNIILAGIRAFNFNPSGLYRSTDGGLTWELVLTGFGVPDDIVSVSESDVPELFMSMSQTGPEYRTFRSSDGGVTWEPFVEGLPGPPFRQGPTEMTAFEGRLYAAMLDRGVWRTSMPVVASESAPADGEAAAVLAIYPNPSSGAPTVALELADAADIRVAVYDILGRRVALLHDGPLHTGEHRFTFDGIDLPSGTYVVRVTGDSFDSTQRVTLTR